MAEVPPLNPPLPKSPKTKATASAKLTAATRIAPVAAAPTAVPFADQPKATEPALPAAAAIVLPPVIDRSPVVTADDTTTEITPAAPTPAVANAKESTMNDTMNTANDTMHKVDETAHTAANTMNDAAHAAGTKATEMFGDMNARAKDAMAKGTKAIEEFVEFSKENMEALATSGRVAAKGAEEIAKYSAEFGRSTIQKANETAKQFAAVKSPTEFFQLQGEVAKQTLDALVAEGSKFTENYLKLMGEVTQPISSRVAVAADKMKPTTNA